MFDIGWPELLVVACVAILVVGPKDLPRMLRTFGRTIGNIKRMAGDFQKQFDDAIRDTELEELKREVSSNSSFAPLDDARKSMEEFQKNVKAEMEAKVSDKPADVDHDTKQVAEKTVTTPAKKKRTTTRAATKSPAKARAATSTKKTGKRSQ